MVPNIGDKLPVRGGIGGRQPRRGPTHPGADSVVVAPGHRDQAERRVDRKALADGIDGNQVSRADFRRRAVSRKVSASRPAETSDPKDARRFELFVAGHCQRKGCFWVIPN